MARIPVLFISSALLLAACSGGEDDPAPSGGATPAPAATIVPADAPGHVNEIPATPRAGESRAGTSYSIYIQVPTTGDTFAFTVFEPSTIEGGKKYPLVLYGHGGGEQRVTNANDPATANQPINNPKQFIEHGYGVISMDQRGHGESGGTIRLMDPDYEGLDLLAMLDWAEAKLDWLAYGPSVDGSDPHNLVLGAIGASYGGAFQLLLNNIDPKRRLDAIVPEATFHDVRYSIYPNQVVKSGWGTFLFLRLMATSNGQAAFQLDPYAQELMLNALTSNRINQEGEDFLYYHSNAYFCDGRRVSTNGGPDATPLFPPRRPGKVNALFMQGMRDTLFNFNEAYLNYQCLRANGGDVRLRSYQFGHNATPVVLDPGVRPVAPNPDPAQFTPPLDSFDSHCGSQSGHEAGLAFFDEHLKGIKGAADVIPRQICLSLATGDAVLMDEVISGRHGVEKDVPATTVISGVPDVPIAVDLGVVAGEQGDVIGGIPHLQISLRPAIADADAFVFLGIGVMRASLPGVWELADNQITPLRGFGDFDVDMVGVAERLAPGDKVGLLIYGGHNQYPVSGAVNLAQPRPMPITVEGKIWVPMLGPMAAAP